MFAILSNATFVDILLYSCDKISREEVYNTLFSKEKIEYLVVNLDTYAESFVVHGRTSKRGSSDENRGRSKSRNKTEE